MKVAKLRTQTRKDDVNMRSLNLASYGEKNDYPDKIIDIFNSSSTGKGCLNTARRFIYGAGFCDVSLGNYIINRKGETLNHLLRKAVDDYPQFGGFALHINYNGLLTIEEIQIIPFEHCRISIDKDGNSDGQIAVHPNWNNRNKLNRFKKEDIKRYPVFNPNPVVIQEQIMAAGGDIANYSGQVLYFSYDGDLVYPLSPSDSIVTDMATEESISTVLHRNARYNFLPAGMIVKKSRAESTDPNNEERDDEGDLANEINNWQGDERAAKMILVETHFDEEEPKFVPFNIQNFDKMFDSTSKYIQDNIGRLFMQPPILRGVDVGAGFGAELIKNAYDFYNSIIESDRQIIEGVFIKLLKLLPVDFNDYSIKPLEYIKQASNEELGS